MYGSNRIVIKICSIMPDTAKVRRPALTKFLTTDANNRYLP